MTKLSEAQRRVLTILAEHPDKWLSWRQAGARNLKTVLRLAGCGLIGSDCGTIRITPAGLAALKETEA